MRVVAVDLLVIFFSPFLMNCDGQLRQPKYKDVQETDGRSYDNCQDILNKIAGENEDLLKEERRTLLGIIQPPQGFENGTSRLFRLQHFKEFRCAMVYCGGVINSVYMNFVKHYKAQRQGVYGRLYPIRKGIVHGKLFLSYCKWVAFLEDDKHPLAKRITAGLTSRQELDDFAHAMPRIHVLRRPLALKVLRRYAKMSPQNCTRIDGTNLTAILIHNHWSFPEKDLRHVNLLHRAVGAAELTGLSVDGVNVIPYERRCTVESEGMG